MGGLGERNVFFLVIKRRGGTTCACFISHGPPPPLFQTLIYAGQPMANDKKLAEYRVPPVREREKGGGGSRQFFFCVFWFTPPPPLSSQGCQALIAIETARLTAPHDPDSPFWD